MRFIIILVALAVIVMVLKRLWQTPGRRKKTPLPFNRTVQCAHCGIYTPEAEATERGGRYYCSQEHLAAHTNDRH